MKFKRIVSLILAFILVASVSASAKTLEFTLGEKTVYESDNGISSFDIETEPYIKNDRTMVPVRVISEKFGAQVEWLGDTRQVVISQGENKITLTIGSREAVFNGEKTTLDVKPEIVNDKTMVPLRFISECLGKDVEYVAPTKQILITDNKPIMSVGKTNIYYDDFVAAMLMLGYSSEMEPHIDTFVSTAVEELTNIFASYEYLSSSGITPSDEYLSTVSEVVESSKESLASVALVAPFAKLLSADCFLTYHTINQLNTAEALDEAFLMYNTDFVTAKHILILAEDGKMAEAKKQAEEILAKIKAGEDFDTLMLEHSEDPGVALYPDGYTFTYGEMVEEFEEVAFGLEIGQVSDLVETSFGYHIIKREPLTPADSSMADQLLNILSTKKYQQIISEANEKIEHKTFMTNDEIVELIK